LNAKTHRFLKRTTHIPYKYDYFQLEVISSHLQEKHFISSDMIKLDWYLVLYPDSSILGVYQKIDYQSFSKKFIVHSPDVMVCSNESNLPLLIVELDGIIHHETNRKKNRTKRRNKNYHLANIPCIIIESDDLTSDKSWKKFLDDSIRECFGDDGIIPGEI